MFQTQIKQILVLNLVKFIKNLSRIWKIRLKKKIESKSCSDMSNKISILNKNVVIVQHINIIA